MPEPSTTVDPKRKRFLWGIAIGWFSFIPLLYGCANAFKGVSEQKATGVGAIAGGVAEVCIFVGALVLLLSPLIAIYLLVTSWSRGQAARTFFSVLTMLWSGFTLFLILGAAWLIFVFHRQHHLR
jgi:hypothetical protein